ncbi:hypothetical protein BC830DRAFT_22522 [Chytriomyces sp. MP71]|nr:hypothetical protein BC830DRAFT_22522 [Chytriomyces sp. MP71]
MKEGFSKSQVATSAEPTSKPAPTEAESNAAAGATPETDDDDVYISDPTVDAFSKLTTLDVSYSHLSRAPWLLDEKYSDQILAEAFNAGIRGDLARTRVCVHQSLLLQYCRLLGKDGVRLFFERLRTKGHKGQEAFFTDVESTYARIEKRVGELKREEEEAERKEKEEGEARARAALQPDGTYALPVTEESSEEDLKRAEVFKELPVALQRALLTQDIDEINAFLGSSSKEDTEKYVSLATSVGLISLSTEED